MRLVIDMSEILQKLHHFSMIFALIKVKYNRSKILRNYKQTRSAEFSLRLMKINLAYKLGIEYFNLISVILFLIYRL